MCSHSTEKKEKEDMAKEEEPKEEVAHEKPAPKSRNGQSKDAPTSFFASFLAGLEVYQAKMLVIHQTLYLFKIDYSFGY